jgi:hypothetical protein
MATKSASTAVKAAKPELKAQAFKGYENLADGDKRNIALVATFKGITATAVIKDSKMVCKSNGLPFVQVLAWTKAKEQLAFRTNEISIVVKTLKDVGFAVRVAEDDAGALFAQEA